MRKSANSAFTLNLKSLECFRATVDQGTASAAAKHLRLTQPAVSRLLRVLEEAAGFELFYRRKGRLIATDEALRFYKEVDIALDSIERVSQLVKNLRNTEFGELKIVSPPSFSEGILSGVVSSFIAKYPNVHVSLNSESAEIARDMVALRAADCGFIKLPAEHPGIDCRPLISSGTVCALRRSHRLASKETIKVTDLDNEPLILLGKGRASRQSLDDAFVASGVSMKVRIETHTVGAACALARNGSGIAIISEMLSLPYADRQVVLRRFSPNIPHRYAFTTSTNAPMTRVTQRFYDHCRDYFAGNARRFKLHSKAR